MIYDLIHRRYDSAHCPEGTRFMLGLCGPDEKRVMHVHVKHTSSSPMGVSI
jgi:hypothetical protein